VKLRRLTFHHVRIPLRREIRHASHARTDTDSLVVRAELDDGTTGWGEGVPREYVTGETIDAAWNLIEATPLTDSLSGEIPDLPSAIARLESLRFIGIPAGQRTCFGNSVRCAIELSVLDAVCRRLGLPLSAAFEAVPDAEPILAPTDVVRYSAAIMSMSPTKAAMLAIVYRLAGFRTCKLKVSAAAMADLEVVRSIRTFLGRSFDIRLDANEAWTADELDARLQALAPYKISSVEQPIPHEQLHKLRGSRGTRPIPIMLDESLCSLEDADAAIRDRTCDLFNIRLSKCGGLIPSLRIALRAKEAGIGYQLGCQVGETGILSAAGRTFASTVAGLQWIEGSFDRFLVRTRLTKQDITFTWGGKGKRLTTPGLGIEIDEQQVKEVTIRTQEKLL
jgi:L-alanine-DL-glutamate epimerase-like enolase superfamily enzyme